MTSLPPTDQVTLAIPGTWNARDAATLTGLTPGVVIRSAALMDLTDAGRSELARLGVTDVVDLRSELEVAAQGNDAVASPDRHITEHAVPMAPGSVLGPVGDHPETPQAMGAVLAKLREPGFAEGLLTQVYVELVTKPEWVAQLGRALGVLARSEGATLVHCSAGKDRTGVLVALTAEIAGAEREAINADYLHSNLALADQRSVVPPGISEEDLEIIAPLLGVHLVSLEAARTAINTSYGGLPGFLTAAGVDHTVTGLIRDRFGSSG
ncbi:tyrosine-protein phosphatase [Salana multivorans]